MLRELITRNRSYRRFKEDEAVSIDTLRELVDLARLSASAANLQPLRYILVSDPDKRAEVFPYLTWAGYLHNWAGPEEGERPPAYIVVLGDTVVSNDFRCDHGIASQSILLGAVEKGLGGCILGAIRCERIRELFEISSRYEILLVIAIGKPAEEVVLHDIEPGGNIKYWRDDHDVHHVPKRSLKELIIATY
jgi:nitroreductase